MNFLCGAVVSHGGKKVNQGYFSLSYTTEDGWNISPLTILYSAALRMRMRWVGWKKPKTPFPFEENSYHNFSGERDRSFTP